MICTSIRNKNLQEILSILDDPYVEMAEIRLDLCPDLSEDDMETLFSSSEKALVATYPVERGPESYLKWPLAAAKLKAACEAGAGFIDLDINAPADISKVFQKLCRDNGVGLIRSYHDPEGRYGREYLLQVAARALRYGADIIKIAVGASSAEAAQTVMSLYGSSFPNGKAVPNGRLIAFAMGEEVSFTRIEALRLGAPFTYASVDESEATAPGQPSTDSLHKAVYGDTRSFFRDGLQMPSSKSFAQRAIIAAALAKGTSHLNGYTSCDDCESAIRAARAIGAKISRRAGCLTIEGAACRRGTLSLEKINAGESGLLARILIPLMTVLNNGPVTINGRGTLLTREMTDAIRIMAAFGVVLKKQKLPLTVCGPLIGGLADIPGNAGSQLVSGLMMSLPLCGRFSKVYVSEPVSLPYVFITADVLRRFGVGIKTELEGDAELLAAQDWSSCTGMDLSISGDRNLKAADIDLEADWSSAANFLVAGAIFGMAGIDGLDTQSLQADISILDILVNAGARVCVDTENQTVTVRKAPLASFSCNLSHCPDLFPITAVLAAFSDGESELCGVGRIRGKESDRASAILSMLGNFGVQARIEGDSLFVSGERLSSRILNGRLLNGGGQSSFQDHRMAMAISIAAIGASSEVEIDDTSCVRKSFPGFFETLR